MTNIDKEREAFEKEAINLRIGEGVISLSKHDNGEYVSAITRIAFKAWQLASAKQHSGEAVAWMLPNNEGLDSLFRDNASKVMCKGNDWSNWIPLYLSPQQPESVAEAYERAAELIIASIDSIGDKHSYNGTDLSCFEHERIATVQRCEAIVRNLINQPT